MIVGIDRVISTEICGNTKHLDFFPECLLCSLEIFPESQLVPEAAAFVASEYLYLLPLGTPSCSPSAPLPECSQALTLLMQLYQFSSCPAKTSASWHSCISNIFYKFYEYISCKLFKCYIEGHRSVFKRICSFYQSKTPSGINYALAYTSPLCLLLSPCKTSVSLSQAFLFHLLSVGLSCFPLTAKKFGIWSELAGWAPLEFSGEWGVLWWWMGWREVLFWEGLPLWVTEVAWASSSDTVPAWMDPIKHCFPKDFTVKNTDFLSSDKLMWKLHLLVIGNGGIENLHSMICCHFSYLFITTMEQQFVCLGEEMTNVLKVFLRAPGSSSVSADPFCQDCSGWVEGCDILPF